MKDCPCCKNKKTLKFIEIYELQQSPNTSRTNKSSKFTHLPYYCDICGHIWNTKPPSAIKLKDHYQDQLPHVAEDYDIEKRMSWIHETIIPLEGKTLLDFGSNGRGIFHKTLEDKGVSLQSYDMGLDTLRIVGDFDVITCYFVLEHIVDLDEVILIFKSFSHKNTILIIEVPGSEIYGNNFEIVTGEHQQHFQQKSLEVIMAYHGYLQLRVDWEKCSRSYGFVASFEYTGKQILINDKTHIDTRQNYLDARNAQINYKKNYPLQFIANNRLHRFSTIIIWGVNAYYEDLMLNNSFKDCRIIALDINDKKSNHLGDDVEFYDPEIFLNNLPDLMFGKHQDRDAATVVITACLHTKSILPRLTMFKDIFIYDPIIV